MKRQKSVQIKQQRGVVMAMLAVALVAMVGIVGLALDGGHATLSSTRLQNVVDAAALSAAKTLDQTSDTVVSQAEALSMFSSNADDAGNSEIEAAYNSGELTVSVEFSNSLDPFVSGSAPERYVRVSADNFELDTWFAQVLGIGDIEVATTAVAGPSPALQQICNVAPVMVCGDAAALAGGDPYMGYEPGRPYVLKASNPNDCGTPGNGNFQLIRLDGAQGGADIREGLAGSYGACLSTQNQIDTEPGNTVGPSIQGLNTRFGQYQGGNLSQDDYPPDVVVTEAVPALDFIPDPNDPNPDPACRNDAVTYDGQVIATPAQAAAAGYYNHAGYRQDLTNHNYDYPPIDGASGGTGAFGRRTIVVPVGDCTQAGSGQTSMPMLGALCFHLLQSVSVQSGGNGGGGNGNGGGGNGNGGGNDARIFGEFLGTGCGVTGNPGSEPGEGPGPYVIQLYKDPDAIKS